VRERPLPNIVPGRLEMAEDAKDLQTRIDALTARLEQAQAVNRDRVAGDPNRPLRDYTSLRVDEIHLGYTAPNILAEEYQIPPGWINMVQRSLFHGLAYEDATQHLANFEEICTMLKVETISQEDLKRMAFTFSLADKVKNWIRGQRPENMDTWAKIANAFLNRFFPPSKTSSIRHQIHNFQQGGDKMMSEAWEHFNELQRSCPHHGIEAWSLLQIFYCRIIEGC
jgi:Retrotransposon gag protein